MKTTLKILALLIALAIPAPSKAGAYLYDSYNGYYSNVYLAHESDFRDNAVWGSPMYIWQTYDYNGTYDAGYYTEETITISLTQDITIAGPIYIPFNKRLVIHTNGHKITPLQASKTDWTTDYWDSLQGKYRSLDNITNGDPKSDYFYWDVNGYGVTTITVRTRENVPLCSFFVEGQLYINCAADGTPDSGYEKTQVYGNNTTINAHYYDDNRAQVFTRDVTSYDSANGDAGSFIIISPNDQGTNDWGTAIPTRVKICNLDVKYFAPSYINGKPFASFLSVATWEYKDNNYAEVELENVDISQCYDDQDAGIILANYSNIYNAKDRSHSKFTMTKCNISSCWAGGKNHYGGIIKGYAHAHSQFTLNECTISNCISPGFGGAISWAPLGVYNSQKSSLTLNKCNLTGNFARYMGGAICSEAVVNLNNCTINGNTAGYAGGALAAMPNTIGEFTDNVGFNLVGNTISNNKTLYATNMDNSNAEDPGYYIPTSIYDTENSTSFRTSYCIQNVSGSEWGDINYPSGGGGIWMFLNKENWDFSATIGEGNTITGNTSARAGGGVYVYKKAPANKPMSITLKGDITNNTAATVGGGFAMGSNATLPSGSEAPIIDLTGGNIKGNIAGTDGGGLYMPAGTFHMNGGNIEGNKAPNGYGGGVAMGSTTTIFANGTPEITLSSGSIQDNVAKFRGGGVFMPAGTFTMSGGDIKGNEAGYGSTGSEADAGSGGGVGLMASVDNKLPTFKLQNGNIYNNKATNGNGGGVALAAGTLNISDCDIYGNIATTNREAGTSEFFNEKVRGSGGGIAMKNGSITVTGNSNIHSNQCKKFGAGLYTYKEWTDAPSTDADYNTASFTGGTFHDNGKSTTTPCYSGGGICVEGPVKFTFSANVESNQAYNGGGIAVGAYAQMNYTGGLIRNNHAISHPDPDVADPTTGFEKTVIQVDGMGGGIFMGHNTKLAFNIPTGDKFGLYNNIADHGADDIFANGLNTSITLPIVKDMTLDGLSVPAGSLFWVEDYITNDEKYTSGTKKMGTEYPASNDKHWKNWRYRDALALDGYKFYTVDGGTTLSGYISLALGYQIIYINIIKKGMKPGDSALFKVQSGGSDYLNVMLTTETDKVSEEADGTVTLKKRVCLIGGDWTVVEVDKWSWAYTAVTGTISKSGLTSESSEADRTFTFENTYKSDIPNIPPKHDEGVKVNQIIPIE